MYIGVPKERRPFEYRVGLPPAGIEILVDHGHSVFVEHGAGMGAGFSDQEYEAAGARLVYSSHEVFGRADLICKIARPLQEEIDWMQAGTTLLGYLHLASTRQDRIDAMLQKQITAIAYEQIQLPDGSLPVLRPLSQIGGLMTSQIAARFLQNNFGGKGILLGGIAGVPPAEVVILGAGTAGINAAKSFLGLGAHVTLLDRSMDALQRVADTIPLAVTMIASKRNIDRACHFADVVVGAILVPGGRTPVIVPRETLRAMKPRSLVIDLSIDQGGCFETSRPTMHDRPTFVEEGITHYCVPNIPGVVGRTATHAFINAAMLYILEIARGVETAIENNPAIAASVNTYNGQMMNLQRISSAGGDDGLE